MNNDVIKCLVLACPVVSRKIEEILTPEYICSIYDRMGTVAESDILNPEIDCAIIHITKENFHLMKSSLERMKSRRNFPVLSLIQNIDPEIARICGKIGVDGLIEAHNLRNLKSMLSKLIFTQHTAITLDELGISLEKYPLILRSALMYIEKNYISLLSVSQIANAVSISECALSRLFKKNSLAGPKKILVQFKLLHAFNLLNQSGMSLKKAAEYSGFSNEKRLIECFNIVYHQPPIRYFKQHIKDENSIDRRRYCNITQATATSGV